MSDSERLYNLLPAVYRVRDEAQGGPLRALLAIIENELQAIEADIDDLYHNWFIETCAEWVVPYIGDLLGVRAPHPIEADGYSLRSYVANTLAYRRRKGTAAVLEQLAWDVTRWRARVVEFFQLLATTQHLNHLRPENVRTPDLRMTDELELLDTPFENTAHTAEVRRIAVGRGKYNIPNLGIFLWRLQSYPVERSTARAVTDPSDGRYRFSPLGLDSTLLNDPQAETKIIHLAEEINVPGSLRRRPLYEELEARRQSLVDEETPQEVYFSEGSSVLKVFVDNEEVPPEEILICDLSDPPMSIPTGWRRPPDTKEYIKLDESVDPPVETPVSRPIQVAIDPVLGRLAFPKGEVPDRVQVSCAYGFSSEVGGGPYNRQKSVEQWYAPPDGSIIWQIGVTQNEETLAETTDEAQLVQTMREAINEWNAYVGDHPDETVFGIVAVMDSGTYEEDLTGDYKVEITAGNTLAIVAADWPAVDDPDEPDYEIRIVGQFTPDEVRPHLLGNVSVVGTGDADTDPGEFILDGLLIEGMVKVLVGDLGGLWIAHCTLAPGEGGLQVNTSTSDADRCNDNLSINIKRSICGEINLGDSESDLRIVDSIVHHPGDTAISANSSAVDLQTSTVFGRSEVRSLDAGNSIFTDTVIAQRRQIGCVRFCFVPEGSRVPRRYRCQPALEIATQVEAAQKSNPHLTQSERDAIAAGVLDCLFPSFTSTRYGLPTYGQLHLECPEEIKTGAEDGSEMGVFSHLKQPQREANLIASLREYLRFGLETGIFYVT